MDKNEKQVNMYRTKHYIVEQNISINILNNVAMVYSYDVYYLRNKHRDKLFNANFKHRYNINGKRVHTTIYVRKYID